MDSNEKHALLLLPTLSLPLHWASLKAAYEPAFEALFKTLNNNIKPNRIFRVTVGIVSPDLGSTNSSASRTYSFPEVQSLLAKVYTLICVVAAKTRVDLDVPGGLDVRLLLLDARKEQGLENDVEHQAFSGPLVDVPTFVTSQKGADIDFYSVDGERGLQCWDEFVWAWQTVYKATPSAQSLPCGPAITTASSTKPATAVSSSRSSTVHTSVAVGGTFDHIHIGHKLLLTAVVLLAAPNQPTPRKIIIGITNEALLVNKKFSSVLESWSTRQKRTADFIESVLVLHPDPASVRETEVFDNPGPNGYIVRVTYAKGTESEVVIDYVAISDPFGPTITEENITALVISKETRAGGKAVNDKRREKGWAELEIFEVDVLDAGTDMDDEQHQSEKESFESKISSTEIRKKLEAKGKAANGNEFGTPRLS